ncbi:uncharacterized protein LOC141714552 [Apium graveolens]|uniref:uncharacterized protein LOC141714552 n=1 Tax=Apium graveolens TaxID=4045 RepID=UPI003D78D9D2
MKVIANRMKKVLETVISGTQSAFLPGRLISDNIMVSFEIMHYLKRKKFGKEGCMVIKSDMSKAYDRIEWRFLRVHGDFESDLIKPSRGLRQGDPLSPYLFIVCTKGLSALISHYESKKWLTGVKICRRVPVVNHTLFSDDIYLYCKEDTGEAMKYNKDLICQNLQIKEADNSSKYLGLPNILGRNKSVVFSYLKDKVKASIQNWSEKNVSKPAKEILLKMVTQALPSFSMNIFLLPMELVKDIEKCMSKFFWSTSKKSKSRISWMAWHRMSKHKYEGGMGFRCLRDFNMAMLGKQCWRQLTNPDSLVAHVYKARYYADKDFMEAELGNSPSFIWHSMWEAKNVISSGSCWRIGNGNNVSILQQPWLQNVENPYIVTNSPAISQQKVASLFRTDAKQWDIEIIQDVFEERDQQSILNTMIEQGLEKDVLCWKHEHSGQYSVKSAYRLIQSQKVVGNEEDNSTFWRWINMEEDRDFVKWLDRVLAKLMNPMLAETMAIKEVLTREKQIEWREVIIESDCLVVIQMIRSVAPMRSRLGMVVEDGREIVRQSNNNKLVFVKRSANIPAHELAHVSYMYPDCIFYWESVPVRIKVCIHQDLME